MREVIAHNSEISLTDRMSTSTVTTKHQLQPNGKVIVMKEKVSYTRTIVKSLSSSIYRAPTDFRPLLQSFHGLPCCIYNLNM